MQKPHNNRKITLELLPEAGATGPPPNHTKSKLEGTKEHAPSGSAGHIQPEPSFAVNLSALFSCFDSKILDSLGSLALPSQPTPPELEAADTLREGFRLLPSVGKPLYSVNSLNQVQQDLLSPTKQELGPSDLKRFVMVECSKDSTFMEVVCDQDGHPTVVELPSAVGNIAFPMASSSGNVTHNVELRYVPLKVRGPGPAGDVAVSTPGAEVTRAKKEMGRPKSTPTGQDKKHQTTKGSPVILSLHNIRRLKDGLVIDAEIATIICETLKSTTTKGRKRGRTGDVPDQWDEPTDEEILANLLMSHPPMKAWHALDLKKEIRKVRNRFSAELSRMRKKPSQCQSSHRLDGYHSVGDVVEHGDVGDDLRRVV